MLIAIIFASILSSIALINSLKSDWNWFQSRVAVRKTAMEWFMFPDEAQTDSCSIEHRDTLSNEKQADSYKSIEYFAKHLEGLVPDSLEPICGEEIKIFLRDSCNRGAVTRWLFGPLDFRLPTWICIKPFAFDTSRLPTCEERKKLYSRLVQASSFVRASNLQSRKALEITYDNLIESQYENLSLVRIPILGIAFDINNLGLISGVVFFSLMILLYLSMVRESRNLKTLFTHGWRDNDTDDRRLYELLSMYQVLTIPLKLYSPDKTKDKLTRKFIFGIFLMPAVVLGLVLLYDRHTFIVGTSLNPFLTWITSSSTFGMFALVCIMAYKIAERQIRIDRQWDNQYYRLNLEKLFNLKRDDAETSIWTTPEQVKINWANTVERIKNLKLETSEISEAQSIKQLEKFVDDCYDNDPNVLEKSKREHVDSYWEHLQDWFKENKVKSTRQEFRKSLKRLMNRDFGVPER